jgi:hypothetical protein
MTMVGPYHGSQIAQYTSTIPVYNRMEESGVMMDYNFKKNVSKIHSAECDANFFVFGGGGYDE